MSDKSSEKFNILAIDCCEHTLSAIKKIASVRLSSITSRNHVNGELRDQKVNLIVIGAARFPVRRLIINRLRKVYHNIPMLFLRLEKVDEVHDEQCLRGEFLISDEILSNDLEVIQELRRIFPLKACDHLDNGGTYRLVRETLRIITDNYSNPNLDLDRVAKKLPVSPSKLSRILNQQVGISFRQLLKQIRIERAKLMLASHKYTVKEIAARTGFSDSHYFSRSFKEVTGVNATKYEHSVEDLI